MSHVQIAYLDTEGVHIGVHFLLESPHIPSPDCLYRHNHCVTAVSPHSAANVLEVSSAQV